MEENKITAPYNFVPFSKENIFFPNWADNTSQDIPFLEGESGYIDLEIQTKSPFYIRNAQKFPPNTEQSTKNANRNYIDFFNIKHPEKGKQYAIPATSLKGMLRSVLEIMSFGKMPFANKSGTDTKDKFVFRDFDNEQQYMNKLKNVRCGWLQKKNEAYSIEDLGSPEKIPHENISTHYKSDLKSFFSGNLEKEVRLNGKREKIRFNPNDDRMKTARFKYDNFPISFLEKQAVNYQGKNLTLGSGTNKGKLVFTGQPGFSKTNSKRREFLFPVKSNAPVLNIPDKVWENFLHIYEQGNEGKASPDWLYWKEKLDKGEKIPIFFKLQSGEIESMGLSYLYKLVYSHALGELLLNEEDKSKLDLAECIFGYAEESRTTEQDNKNSKKLLSALKGRVQFGHAFLQDEERTEELKNRDTKYEVLSSPKATFYPFYIKQDVKANASLIEHFKTYEDIGDSKKELELAGRKRYPVSKNIRENKAQALQEGGKVSTEVATAFQPLPKDLRFEGRIHFHNLLPVELGALLSALSFHNNQGQDFFHSLGMAKPLGYGVVKVVARLSKGMAKSPREYMAQFEQKMNLFLGSKWSDSEAIKELFSMAAFQDNKGAATLKYMPLVEHQHAKNKMSRKGLPRYTAFGEQQGIKVYKPATLIHHDHGQGLTKQLKEQLLQIEQALGKECDFYIKEKEAKKTKLVFGLEKELKALANFQAFVKQLKELITRPYKELEPEKSENKIWKDATLHPFVKDKQELLALKAILKESLALAKAEKKTKDWNLLSLKDKIISHALYQEWVQELK